MGSAFNPHILVEKLSKLNSSQQSIETLSHWCIFHMNKAKQVVETWARQFHCAPHEQRLAFLYLANDILQNSRRKGAEFVAEFWKVLPDSLRDVIDNGDEFGRNAALRLINIWEERKVFGSRGQILKEECVKRQLDNDSRNLKQAGFRLRSPVGNTLDKLVSGYQAVYSSHLDEDALFNKCRSAINFIDKVDKDCEGDYRLGRVNSSIAEELQGQHTVLRDCIEQLAVVESSRANLVSLLQEALQEQLYKLDQVRDQFQAAQAHSEQVGNICRQLLGSNADGQTLPNFTANGIPGEQSISVSHTQQIPPFAEKLSHIKKDPKSAAAAVAAKLAASTSSAEMLTLVLSSLAPEGVIGNPLIKLEEYPPDKRAKIESELNPDKTSPPPPQSSSPPPLMPPEQPYLVPQYMQTALPILGGPYGYNMGQQPTAPTPAGYALVGGTPISGVSTFAPSSNSNYESYPPEGGFYGQPSSLPMAPMSHQ